MHPAPRGVIAQLTRQKDYQRPGVNDSLREKASIVTICAPRDKMEIHDLNTAGGRDIECGGRLSR